MTIIKILEFGIGYFIGFGIGFFIFGNLISYLNWKQWEDINKRD